MREDREGWPGTDVFVTDVAQGSEDWFAARAGYLTSSVADDALATPRSKGGFSLTRHKLKARLVVERLTRKPVLDDYTNKHMERGKELEPFARMAYEELTGEIVKQVGFCVANGYEYLGCSPDGLVGEDGLIEIKCPMPHVHMGYMMRPDKDVPPEYVNQMVLQLLVTNRKWVDFISFCDAMPEKLKLYVVRFEPSQDILTTKLAGFQAFLDEVKAEEEKWRKIA